jgi:hypothetical protein
MYKGVKIYRKDIESKFKLTAYQQRKAEESLIGFGLLKLEAIFDGINRFNLYTIDFENLYKLVKGEITLEGSEITLEGSEEF